MMQTRLPLPPDGGISFDEELCALLNKAWEVRTTNFPAELVTVWPSATKAVSLTGGSCALNCAHCGGHYLEGMTDLGACERAIQGEGQDLLAVGDAGDPREWAEVKSCLISGGCDRSGRVPILQAKDRLKAVKDRFRLNMHVGLVSEEEAKSIGEIADVVSFDLVGDDETIREVYGLDQTAVDYFAAFDALSRYVSVVPHICIGLKGGELAGERAALDFLVKRQVKSLAFIVFTPTPGSRYADRKPPELNSVAKFLAEARSALPGANLHLGCMRPKGSYRIWLDIVAVRAGMNRIVQPTPWARALAQQLGLTLVDADECCVL